jgi:integrase
MAAQYRRGKKSPWVVQYRGYRGGERGRVITASFKKREDAETFEAKISRERKLIARGMELPQEELLLLDFSKTWVKRRIESSGLAKGTSLKDASRLKNYWLPHLGDTPVALITSAQILERLDYIQHELGHSPADRNRHRALMHKLFQDLFMAGKIETNPVARIPLIQETPVRKRTRIADDVQLEVYLTALWEEGVNYWVLAIIMRYTGCRISEAIGLQYQDVLENDGAVVFRRIEEREGGSHIVERTKGAGEVEDEDAHVMPLFPALKEAIASHREKSRFCKAKDFVAATPEAGSYTPYDSWKDAHARAIGRASEEFKKAHPDAEFQPFTAHAFRRFFTTEAKKAGYTRTEIQEMLGHSSEAVTKRYDLKDISHLVEKGKRLGFGVEKLPENVARIRS